MRKQVATLLTGVFLVSLSVNANAAIKPGTLCKKIGLTSIYSGKKYTCVKSGNKLVWNSGINTDKKVPTNGSANDCNGGLHLGVATKERVSADIAKFNYEALNPCSYLY